MTDKENNVVQQHFDVLQGMEQDLAGRTLHMDSFGFGIIILEVHSEEKRLRNWKTIQ
ncbi:hypothetical protein ACFPYN_14245 [Paenisporosarcina macmurdoensis]|uniref:Uncharacterized protein n=1 Tax=Paenisporosarcina macmurdoensis TaxID=212659 RepID=A0ABW1LA48_9BACL